MKNLHTNKLASRSLFAAILLLMSATISSAQLNVGSNTAPNAGAMLEVSGTTKGLLMPRVSLTHTTKWGLSGTQIAGMIVYNGNAAITSTDEDYPKHPSGTGIYYWDGIGWISSGASNFSADTGANTLVVYVNKNSPNVSDTFYTETDEDVAIPDNSLKAQTAALYVGANGSTWIWSPSTSTYISKKLPKATDHDWYLSRTKTAPTNIRQSAYAMGKRGIGIETPTYPLDVRNSGVISTNSPVYNSVIGNFQNTTSGNVAIRMGNSGNRFYLGRTSSSATYGSLPANTIFMGQHVAGTSGSAGIAFGTGFGTSSPEVNMYVDNGANSVGIGLTNTAAKLDITGNSSGSNSLQLRSGNLTNSTASNQILFGFAGQSNFRHAIKTRHHSSQQATNAIDFYLWNQGVDAPGDVGTKHVMTLDGTGNVGINTTSPDSRLTIREDAAPVSSADAQINIASTNANRVAAIRMGTGGNATLLGQNGNTANGGLLANAGYWGAPAGGHDFQIITYGLQTTPAPTAAMTVRLNGNIGIGTAIPHAPLQFANGTVTNTENRRLVLYEGGDNEHQFFGFGINSGILRYQTGSQGSDHIFYSANDANSSDELMRIKGNGLVGIGTSTPTSKLNVNGDIEAYVGGSHTGEFWAGTSNKPGVQIYASANDGWLGVQRQSNIGGWVGYFSRGGNYNATNVGLVQFNYDSTAIGQIYANTANSVLYSTTSDIRLKENIRISSLGLADVMKIDVRDYNYKKDSAKTLQTGFIAQQLYTIYPQAVYKGGEDPKTNPWTVDYGKLTPLLTKAIQEQQLQIEALTKQNSMLSAQVTDLKDKEAAYAALSERVKQMEQMIGINTKIKVKSSVGVVSKKK